MKKHISIAWLGLVLLLVIIFGTVYMVVLQEQRSSANLPQIALAVSTAASLNQGFRPASLVNGQLDLKTSLDPFIIIYDKSGRVVAGSGYLNSTIPTIPYGVLSASNGAYYHTVTWQPQANVRIAAVAVAADRYYVVAGQSLKVVETNELRTFELSVFGGLASLIVLAMVYATAPMSLRKQRA